MNEVSHVFTSKICKLLCTSLQLLFQFFGDVCCFYFCPPTGFFIREGAK